MGGGLLVPGWRVVRVGEGFGEGVRWFLDREEGSGVRDNPLRM